MKFYGQMCLLVGSLFAAAHCLAQPIGPPNILLLVAEDLSPRIGAWGDEVASTPNIDALARQSVRYTRAFTAAGVCAPSRAALIMGQHQISFGAQHMRTSTGPLGEYYAQPDPELKAFPELLRRAGYFTFTDSKLDYQFSGVGAGSGPFTIWDQEGRKAHWRQRAPGQPFFGLINFLETHESGVMRMDVEPRNPILARTQRMRQGYGLVAESVTDPELIAVPRYYPDIPEVRADMARHYDNIHAMDARVGRILAELEADGLSDSTIVIWTTDHGDGLPRAKRELLDTGIHVPMLVHVPEAYRRSGWSQGSDDDRLVSFVDIAPTVLAWADVELPAGLHGVNFLTGNREYVYASRDRIDEIRDRQRAARDPRYKYIRSWAPEVPGGHELAYRDNLDMVRAMRERWQSDQLNADQARWFEGAGEEQLYDLHSDPDELTNLIDERSLAEVAERMRAALREWLELVGDMSAIPEAQMRESFLDEGRVPETMIPKITTNNGFLTAHSDNSASIGYRTGDGRWRLYTQPVEQDDQRVYFKAVRYGWHESAVVTVEPQ